MSFTSSDLLHLGVTAGIVVWMFCLLRARGSEPSTPSELTTWGIFGTFIGIFLGLLPFLTSTSSDFSTHIVSLIKGIAVASTCSIFGMGLALWSKSLHRKAKSAQSGKTTEHAGATADTLANLLQELVRQSAEQNERLFSLQKSIAGNEDGTLLTQMQKLRTTMVDKQDQIITSIDSFSQNIAKSNSEALIEALRGVIVDFNTKISEQFGDNFKELNHAVGDLLEWQNNYREEIAELQKRYQACLDGIEQSNVALSGVSANTNSIVEAAAKLEKLLNAYEGYSARLTDQLEAFAYMSKEASDAFPIIERNLKALTEDFSSAVKNSTNEMEKTVTQTSKRLESQITALDEALEEELTKSISSLGNQLTSLSGKFVADYTPLTVQLERLVKSASEGVNN